jgi:HSP20 family molecular chaperone IbpA
MDRLFDRFAGGWGMLSLRRMFDVEPAFRYESSFSVPSPSVDITEDDAGFKVTAELPGMTEKEIEVMVSGDTLTLKGEKSQEKEQKEKNLYLSERSYGSFQRSFYLPEGVDAATTAPARRLDAPLRQCGRDLPEASACLSHLHNHGANPGREHEHIGAASPRSNPSLREIGVAVIERGVRPSAGGAWRADAGAGILRDRPPGMAPLAANCGCRSHSPPYLSGAGPSVEMAALETPNKPLQVHHTGPQRAPFEDHQTHLRSPLAAPARRHRGCARCGQKITDTGS